MRELTGSDANLRWGQPEAKKRFFELRSGDDAVATLEWERRSAKARQSLPWTAGF